MDDSLRRENTAQTRELLNEDWFEPEMDRGVFVAILRCSNVRCQESVAVGGESRVIEEQDPEQARQAYFTVHQPHSFIPAPRLIVLHEKTPEDVVAQIRVAESQVFGFPASAANSIRTAVERLLDDQGVRSTTVTRRRKRMRLSLHARVEQFRTEDPVNADQLLAVKWLGNAGSHDAVTAGSVFDALDILELVLEDLYSPRRREVMSLARRVNKAKGPPKQASRKTAKRLVTGSATTADADRRRESQ